MAKLIAAGCDFDAIRLTFQEYFMRLNRDPKRWGVPLSALLGALYAQIGLGLGAIGGKDSMSGTFEHIDVPPTLISFALAPAKASELIANVVGEAGMKLYRIPMPRDESMIPDFAALAGVYRKVHAGVRSGNIRFATVVENGGIAAAVAKSCLGNGFGFRFEGEAADLLGEQYGELIVSLADPSALDCDKILLGETTEDGTFVCGGASVSQQEAVEAFCGTLEKVFPNHAAASGAAEAVDFDCCGKRYENIATKTAKPRVFIPVFPRHQLRAGYRPYVPPRGRGVRRGRRAQPQRGGHRRERARHRRCDRAAATSSPSRAAFRAATSRTAAASLSRPPSATRTSPNRSAPCSSSATASSSASATASRRSSSSASCRTATSARSHRTARR